MQHIDEEIDGNGRCGGLKSALLRMGNITQSFWINWYGGKVVMWFCGLIAWSSRVRWIFFLMNDFWNSNYNHAVKNHSFAVLRWLVVFTCIFYQACIAKHHSALPSCRLLVAGLKALLQQELEQIDARRMLRAFKTSVSLPRQVAAIQSGKSKFMAVDLAPTGRW